MHNKEAVTAAIKSILREIGEDVEREGLQHTPRRVAEMYSEIFAGYQIDPAHMIQNSLFAVDDNDLVLVRDIEYYSMCEHHMLPFFGRAHVAYIPDGKIIGLSQIPRIVDVFALRLQVQERMTKQIADLLNEVLQPQAVGVMVEGSHFCAMMRGVKKERMSMVTSATHGTFRTNSTAFTQLFDLLL